MNNSIIIFLIQDSFFSKLMLAKGQDLGAIASKAFSSESITAIVLASLIGATCANFVNYSIGAITYKVYRKYVNQLAQVKQQELAKFFTLYAFPILFLGSFIFIGPLIIFLSGFAQVSILRVTVYTMLANIIYYYFI